MTLEQLFTLLCVGAGLIVLTREVWGWTRAAGRVLFTVGYELEAALIYLLLGTAIVAPRIHELMYAIEPTAWAWADCLALTVLFGHNVVERARRYAIYEKGVGSGLNKVPWESIESHSWVRDRKNPEDGPARLRLHCRPKGRATASLQTTDGPKVHGKEMREAIDALFQKRLACNAAATGQDKQ